MSKIETLVRNVTPEAEYPYGGLSVAFYDNPRTYTPKGKEESVTENRLYISIDLIGRKDHVKRKARPGEELKYERAFDLYKAAKKSGGRLDETSQLVDSLAKKNKEIAKNKKEAVKATDEIAELQRQIAAFEATKTTKEE